jgi:hypothetical protein
VVPSAYLRVFQLLEAFPPKERGRWERYLLHPGDQVPRYRQRRTGRRIGLMVPEDDGGADVLVEEGRLYVCPRNVRVRVLAGLLAFRETHPRELADAFVPATEVRRARRELQRLRRRSRGRLSFVHQSPWHVPIRWFVLFDDAERRLEETADGYRLRYLTTAAKAMRRTARVVPVLRRADLGPIGQLLEELHGWLRAFDPRSLLELDYDGLCRGLTWDELDDDRSVRDVHLALEALAGGEFLRSAELYQGVLGRWAELRGREQLN